MLHIPISGKHVGFNRIEQLLNLKSTYDIFVLKNNSCVKNFVQVVVFLVERCFSRHSSVLHNVKVGRGEGGAQMLCSHFLRFYLFTKRSDGDQIRCRRGRKP